MNLRLWLSTFNFTQWTKTIRIGLGLIALLVCRPAISTGYSDEARADMNALVKETLEDRQDSPPIPKPKPEHPEHPEQQEEEEEEEQQQEAVSPAVDYIGKFFSNFQLEDLERPKNTAEGFLESALAKVNKLQPHDNCPEKKAKGPHNRKNRNRCDSRFNTHLEQAPWWVIDPQIPQEISLPTRHELFYFQNNPEARKYQAIDFLSKTCFSNKIKRPNPNLDYRACAKGDFIHRDSGIKDLVDTEAYCPTDEHVNLIHGSFNLVTNCVLNEAFGEDFAPQVAKAFFGLIKHESGLQMNAFSPSKAGGLGQLLPSAIRDYNSESKISGDGNGPDVKGILKNSPLPICRELSKLPPMSESNACDRVSLDKGNPFSNLVYSISYIHRNYKENLATLKKFKDKLSDVSEDVRKNFQLDLALWGHNVGRPSITLALEATMKDFTHLTREDLNSRDSKFWKALNAKVEEDAGNHLDKKLRDALKKRSNDGTQIEQRSDKIQGIVDRRKMEVRNFLPKVLEAVPNSSDCK